MIHNTYFVVAYLLFNLNVHIYQWRTIVSCLYYIHTVYHLNVQSVKIYINLVICNDKHFVTFLREGVNISLSHSNSLVDISLGTYMPIFKFLAPTNSSINSDKQNHKKIIEF